MKKQTSVFLGLKERAVTVLPVLPLILNYMIGLKELFIGCTTY